MKDRLWLCNWRPTGVEKWQVVIFSVLHWRHWRAQPKIREKNPCVVYMCIVQCIGCIGKWTNMQHHISCTCPRYPKKSWISGNSELRSDNFVCRMCGLLYVMMLPAATLPSIFENCKKIHGKTQKKDMWDVSNTSKSWCFRPWWYLMIVPHMLGDRPTQPPSFEVEPNQIGHVDSNLVLVGGFNRLEKYESQWEGWHPIYYGK